MKFYNFKGLFDKNILLLFPTSPVLADEAREPPRPWLDKAEERLKETMTTLA